METSLEVPEGPRLWAEPTGIPGPGLVPENTESVSSSPVKVLPIEKDFVVFLSLLLTEGSAVYENDLGAS